MAVESMAIAHMQTLLPEQCPSADILQGKRQRTEGRHTLSECFGQRCGCQTSSLPLLLQLITHFQKLDLNLTFLVMLQYTLIGLLVSCWLDRLTFLEFRHRSTPQVELVALHVPTSARPCRQTAGCQLSHQQQSRGLTHLICCGLVKQDSCTLITYTYL